MLILIVNHFAMEQTQETLETAAVVSTVIVLRNKLFTVMKVINFATKMAMMVVRT